MNKNVIIAGAIAIGLYLFSQQKKSVYTIAPSATVATERAAEKAAFTEETKRKISVLSVAEKIQALVAFRKKIAAKKNVAPQAVSLTPAVKAKVLLAAAAKKADKKKVAKPAVFDYLTKKQKRVAAAKKADKKKVAKPAVFDYLTKKQQRVAKEYFNFDPWPVKVEPKKKSKLFDYNKPKKKKDLSVLHSAIKW